MRFGMASIDTLEMAKELKAAGFSEGQAEALARAVRRVQADAASESVTKADLRETELRLESKIAETALRLENRIAETRTELLKWTIGAIGVQTLVIVGAVVALARALGG
jgi:hypothetical protein